MPIPSDGRLAAGEAVLFIDRKEREYLRVLRSGARIHIRHGNFVADELIGAEEGAIVRNSAGEPFLLLRPTYAQLIPNLPRRAQVIYPKDVGPILLWGDIYPGARVVEIGTGPGATTIALLRAVGQSGSVTSYEIRDDFVTMAQQNVAQFFGEAPHWTIKLANALEGIEERGVDRIIVDLAEPWTVLEHAWAALRPGGVLIGYVPTVLQVKQLVDRARLGGFGAVQVIEPFLRGWHVKGLSIRPEHRMVAHTGFIVTARRLLVPQGQLPGEAGDVDTQGDEMSEPEGEIGPEDDDLR